MMMEYITKKTILPTYIMCPRFLLDFRISETTKFLYMLLLDRSRLSIKNDGWTNEQGQVFCIFPINELAGELHKSRATVKNCLAELERQNLIRRERMGCNQPNKIYLMVPTRVKAEELTDYQGEKSLLTGESENCPMAGQNLIPHMDRKLSPIKKENNNNYRAIDTSIYLTGSEGDRMDEYEYYREYFLEQLEFDVLLHDCPYEQDILNEILDLLVETVCSKRSTLRVTGDDKPAQVVKSQLMKLNGEHIKYVLSCMKENTTKVKNIKQYLLTALYNAPMTIDSYFTVLVNHDLYGGEG